MNNDKRILTSKEKNVLRKKLENSRNFFASETNSSFIELCKQLILVATVLIPLSAFFFANESIIKSINQLQRYFILSSWILLSISVLFGLIQLYIEYKLNLEWFKDRVNSLIKLRKMKITVKMRSNILRTHKPNQESNKISLTIQSVMLFLGAILIIVSLTFSLFNKIN